MTRWATLVACLASSACTAGEISLDGKSCPCIDGWSCDTARNVCVQPSASTASGGGAIGVGTLTVLWVTSETIRWGWEPTGGPGAFRSYEIVVGRSESDVVNRTGTARVYDADQSPELGVYQLPRTKSSLDDVRATITDGLEPNKEYFAQLVATDTAGGRTRSNVAGARTTIAPGENELPLYVDAVPPDGAMWPPGRLLVSNDKPYEGASSLRYVRPGPECSDGGCFYYENLSLNYGTPIGGAQQLMPEGAFTSTAFLELAIADDAGTPSYWSNIWLKVGGCSDLSCNASIQPLTLHADGAYHVLQIPLRALAFPSGPLTYDDLASPIAAFDVGGNWVAEGTKVWIDSVRLRW